MTLAEIYETYAPGSDGFIRAVTEHCRFELSPSEISRLAKASETAAEFEHYWSTQDWWRDPVILDTRFGN